MKLTEKMIPLAAKFDSKIKGTCGFLYDIIYCAQCTYEEACLEELQWEEEQDDYNDRNHN
jgi:hypothetical protein